MTSHRPWWIVMLVGTLGCGGCGGCAGRDHAIFTAAAKGDVAEVRKYLDEDPTLLTEVYRRPPRGRDPFSQNTGQQLVHIATFENQVDVLKLLKERGADLNAENAQDGNLRQPIHLAASNNRTDVLAWLLDNGVDVNAKTRTWNLTPLHCAVQSLHLEAVELLLARGADVHARTSPLYLSATSLLWMCSFRPHHDREDKLRPIAKALLDQGADVNAQNDNGGTALHLAPNQKALVELLLEQKADISLRDNTGNVPLDYVHLDRDDIAELFIARGVPRETWEKRKRDAAKPAEPKNPDQQD